MTGRAPGCVVTGLHKRYAEQPVLAGLDLAVPGGSLTAVLGPSGSGKTTLLRVLAGFERPDRGTVRIGDTVVDDDHHHVPAEQRRIGYVSQEGSLFPHLSVRANVAFGLARRARRGAAVDELLERVGLADLAARYPHQLSGGQQQRVALARALAVQPEMVLLDEPFASLDATLRADVRADVAGILRDAGATAVLVTHDQDEALSLSDLVAVMRHGRIAQLAAPEDLYAHPLDTDLARFVGEANLIDGVTRGEVVVTALGELAVARGADAAPGTPVTVAVRPEQVTLHPAGGTDGVPARIVRTEYYGHDALVHVVTEPAVTAAPVVARLLGGARYAPGAAVRVSVAGAAGAWTVRPGP